MECLAPIDRHSTHKLLVAHACNAGSEATTLSLRAYVDRLAKRFLAKDLREYPKYETPAARDLAKHYEDAVSRRDQVDPELLKSYPRKVGALIYTVPALRLRHWWNARAMLDLPDPRDGCGSQSCTGVFGVAHGFGHHTYGANDQRKDLHAFVDSDWATGHSTSGWAIMFGGAVIGYGSKRQHSMALSSTEAEIMAASQAASELMYFGGLLRELGYDESTPTELFVDNAGAVEQSKGMKSCQRSRHIERRYLYVRELVAQGDIVVKYVPANMNHADVLTKSFDAATHKREAHWRFDGTVRGRQGTCNVERSEIFASAATHF